jgi:hypothetical protein
MGDGVEVGEGVGVGEGDLREGGPVQGAIGVQNVLTEPLDERLIGGPTGLDDLPGVHVGVENDGAAFGEQAGHGGLSGPDAAGESDHEHGRRPYHRPIAPDLYSNDPIERLQAGRDQGRRGRRGLLDRIPGEWPPYSPGSVNAWLLLVTTKPPSWEDDLVVWEERPLTIGEAHEGFFYPDPLGFWAEIRKWTLELLLPHAPEWGVNEALSVTTLLHQADDVGRLNAARELCRPRMMLFLDEPSWERSGLTIKQVPHYINDPHREGQVYEGFWGSSDGGVTIGKMPQHPTMHNLYREEDMLAFLRSAPSPT